MLNLNSNTENQLGIFLFEYMSYLVDLPFKE